MKKCEVDFESSTMTVEYDDTKVNSELILSTISNQTTFKEWLQTIDNQGIGGGGFDSARWRKYGTYSIDNYVGDGSGKFLVDKIFRLEDINDCLLPFLKKLNLENLPQSIPFINKGSNNENIEEWYDSSSCKIIEKLFHYEIEHFNYRFKK